jgi:hypothetical protein
VLGHVGSVLEVVGARGGGAPVDPSSALAESVGDRVFEGERDVPVQEHESPLMLSRCVVTCENLAW